MDLVLTFATIHEAIAAERKAAALFAGAELVPLPPEVKSDCGFGLLLPGEKADGRPSPEALAEAGIEPTGIYRIVAVDPGRANRKEKRYERIDQED
jgi:hypothetical protein